MHLARSPLAVLLTFTCLAFAACTTPEPIADPRPMPATDAPEAPASGEIRVVLHTNRGPIAATLFADQTPVTVASFLFLADRGFYDGLTFHRVIPNFMIQGGDPSGTGRGGPGYQFEDEIRSQLRHTQAGTLSMANAGPNTNGSQFFITHGPTNWLDGRHTVFGRVTSGMSVVNAIRAGDKIERIDILDDPAPLFEEQAQRIAQWTLFMQ